MSWYWSCNDKNGNDLFDEFEIHSQALGLAEDDSPYSVLDIRQEFRHFAEFANESESAARAAVQAAQTMVRANLAVYTEPAHSYCPCCTCHRVLDVSKPFHLDLEQCIRFTRIPLERVWRASGGY